MAAAGLMGLAWVGVMVFRVVKTRSLARSIDIWASAVVVVAIAGTVIADRGSAFPVRYRLSKASLERYARSAPASSRVPRWVGLFEVKETELLDGGIVRMVTAECMVDHCGFTYSPDREPPRIGEDTYFEVGDGWYLWERSW